MDDGEVTDAREPVPTTLGRGVFHRDPLQLRGARAQTTGNAGSPIAQPFPRSPRGLHMDDGEVTDAQEPIPTSPCHRLPAGFFNLAQSPAPVFPDRVATHLS